VQLEIDRVIHALPVTIAAFEAASTALTARPSGGGSALSPLSPEVQDEWSRAERALRTAQALVAEDPDAAPPVPIMRPSMRFPLCSR